ncbi:hypothetical protein CDAR_238631 [Caerostris darwini]|uniref:Uncharacterized protein n=1 Tax=Caerostris darwini TaxID=1538125 RepID=A0AAV4QEX2_9ARAC|nr:hypothetical protein CDAR_238631 [Caerostris darwini]
MNYIAEIVNHIIPFNTFLVQETRYAGQVSPSHRVTQRHVRAVGWIAKVIRSCEKHVMTSQGCKVTARLNPHCRQAAQGAP